HEGLAHVQVRDERGIHAPVGPARRAELPALDAKPERWFDEQAVGGKHYPGTHVRATLGTCDQGLDENATLALYARIATSCVAVQTRQEPINGAGGAVRFRRTTAYPYLPRPFRNAARCSSMAASNCCRNSSRDQASSSFRMR